MSWRGYKVRGMRVVFPRKIEFKQGTSKIDIKREDGKIIAKRAPEIKALDPERLIIDNCDLASVPRIYEDEQIQLLNLQQNTITHISNLQRFPDLKVLNISDNWLLEISGLDTLFSLRELILAGNGIKCIDGLQALHNLDVLDLSRNKISEITNINHLYKLRVLNLSFNRITKISGLSRLESLVELNLNKNNITKVCEVDVLPHLQKLFLSQNRIERFEDMECLSKIPLLSDLTLEGCPLSALPNYRHLILFNIPQLNVLDTRQACKDEEERQTALALIKKEEQRQQEGIRQAKDEETNAVASTRNIPHLKILNIRQAYEDKEERQTALALMRKKVQQQQQESIRKAKVKKAKVKATASADEHHKISSKESKPSTHVFSYCGVTVTPATIFPSHATVASTHNVPQLKILDTRQAYEDKEERQTALSLMRKEEQQEQEKVKKAKVKAIVSAHEHHKISSKESKPSAHELPYCGVYVTPDTIFPSLATRSHHSLSEDLFCSYCGSRGGECNKCNAGRPELFSNEVNPKFRNSKQKPQEKEHGNLTTNEKSSTSSSLNLLVEGSSLTCLIQLKSGNLELYGHDAFISAIKYEWDLSSVSDIHTVGFHFLIFHRIYHLLDKIKTKFHNITAVSFESTYLESLSQINALGQISDLKALTIENEGNPVLELSLWRMYAVYRLSPTIELINGEVITEMERDMAEDIFGNLGFAASLLLPKYRLSSLLNNSRVKQKVLKEKRERQRDSQVSAEVMKSAFTHDSEFEYSLLRYKTTACEIVENNFNSVEEALKKRIVFQQLWPPMFLDIVNDALGDYTDLNRYMKLSMLNLLENEILRKQ